MGLGLQMLGEKLDAPRKLRVSWYIYMYIYIYIYIYVYIHVIHT